VILTKGEAQAKRVDKKPGITIYSWVDEKTHYEFIKACDVVLSRAGHGIITKAMVYGKPLVLIPIPEHTEQWNNARTCERLGYGVLLEQRNLTLDKLREALKKALGLNPKRLDEVYKKTLLGGWESASNLVYSLTD
jgi:UDP:flavonoid glycosyltransferase YjiC (YdhE family)